MSARQARNPSAGRVCPPEYGYSPAVLARAPELQAEIVYVIGGLYGNPAALLEIERMTSCEDAAVKLIFNGDFHWFDVDPELFGRIDAGVARHTALRGNVETELAGDNEANGCGCAYPESVPDADVDRSNSILAQLRTAALRAEPRHPGLRARLAALPMHLVARIGEARIGIVHGDAWALAGWRFAHDVLHDAGRESVLLTAFEQAALDGFAATHTCLPALKVFDTPLGERFVVNNGSAGMPNFRGSRAGLITRIAAIPLPRGLASARQYGADAASVYVDALAVHFDADAWFAEFDRLWPAGTAAQVSYRRRIVDGPDFSIDDALGRVPSRACATAA
jgi:hypothetical protein